MKFRAAAHFSAILAPLTLLAACGDGREAAQTFAAIDRDRVLAVESQPGEWLTSGRDFGKTHHSPLTQIDREPVSRLGFAWDYDTGTTRVLEATPIVVDGVLYTSGPTGRVYALRADTGEEIWTFDPECDSQVIRLVCCD